MAEKNKMSEEAQNAKHSVGKGAQKEQHNADGKEPSFVKNPKKSVEDNSDEHKGEYLDKKWKKAAGEFRENYNVDVDDSEYKEDSVGKELKDLDEENEKTDGK